MNNIAQDIRYALRNLRKSPAFAAIAVITLALGIGANTAIFTVVNAVFFHPIPVKDPARLMEIFTLDQRKILGGANSNVFPNSFPNAQDIQQRAQSFSGVTVYESFATAVSMTVNGQPNQYFAQLSSGNYFDVLGVHAQLGRTFRPEEDRTAGAGPVVVLNHGFWERVFAANPNVIGQNVLINGQGFSIIGVAPKGFQGTSVIGGPDMWIPISMHDQILTGFPKQLFNERRFLGYSVVARLKDGARPEQAKAELQAIASDLETAFPLANKGRTFTLQPLLESSINPNQRAQFARAGVMLMAVVGIVLVIACFNIANLMLTRAAGRKREMSIRVAIGASRSRIITQLLTEAMVLAITGGVLGLGLALAGRDVMWRFRPPLLPADGMDLSLDWHVMAFTFLVAITTGLIFGLAPALQASRPDLVSELKERAGGDLRKGSRFTVRDVLISLQVAVCLIALVGAGLFLISLGNARTMDTGFDTHNLAMLSFDLGALNYDAPRAREFERRALEAAQNTLGVRSAALSNTIPLFNGGFGRTLFKEGEDNNNGQSGHVSQYSVMSPEYLQTMGIAMVRGQGFDSTIRENTPRVAIINETAARQIWPNEDPIGKRFTFFRDTGATQVIGIVHDSTYNALGEAPRPYMYVPLIQNPNAAVTIFFRTQGDPRSVLSTVRTEVQAMDHNLPITNVWPIGEVISQSLWASSFGASLLTVFAMIAMALCAVGIYGVVGYSVGQRIREFGIRLALGAQPRDVLLMVLKQSALIMAAGLALGLAAAFFLARLIVTFLYGVNTNSPLAFLAMALVLAAVGVFASYIPARRAAKVDPMVALHYE
ncbi:MAG TPA: ABC transporter permease [Candidatus Angelobacter sp.]|jgi:putative ABC transport system permease protein|nr:ABC transporter permease [Candidatus Angelobacter sp.]